MNIFAKKMRTLSFFVLIFLGLCGVFLPDKGIAAGVSASKIESDCEINKGSCWKETGAFGVSLDISPKPVTAMIELSFTVRLSPPHHLPEKITVDLSMPGMFMGKNTVVLVGHSPGLYSGMGIIPRCPSGKKLWNARVNLPAGGKVDYFFDVAY